MAAREVHEVGIERHGGRWLNANRRAVDKLTASTKLMPWNPDVKKALPLVILAILDGQQIDAGKRWDTETLKWIDKPQP